MLWNDRPRLWPLSMLRNVELILQAMPLGWGHLSSTFTFVILSLYPETSFHRTVNYCHSHRTILNSLAKRYYWMGMNMLVLKRLERTKRNPGSVNIQSRWPVSLYTWYSDQTCWNNCSLNYSTLCLALYVSTEALEGGWWWDGKEGKGTILTCSWTRLGKQLSLTW